MLNRIVDLEPHSGPPCETHVVFGEVVGILIEDSVICDGRVSTSLIRLVSRLGYMDYAVTDETFEMMRPSVDGSRPQTGTPERLPASSCGPRDLAMLSPMRPGRIAPDLAPQFIVVLCPRHFRPAVSGAAQCG